MTAAPSKRILVVDDEKDVAEALRYTIEDEGYEVVTAVTVEDALAKTAEAPFAAAVLDVSMGEADGLELARKIRDNPSTADLPIVILTGVEESVVRERFTGYDMFVSKGADLSRLVQQIERLIGGVSGAQSEQHPPA